MKRVVDKHTVAHLWANQTQEDARTSSNNYRFEGKTLYSYMQPIGYLHTNKKGETAAILWNVNYSVTTNGHLSIARSACSQYPTFRAENVTDSPESIRAAKERKIEEFAETVPQHRQARIRAKRYGQLLSMITYANEFNRFFGLKPFPVPPAQEDLEKHLTEQARKRTAAEKTRQAKLVKDARRYLEMWRAGVEYDSEGHSVRNVRFKAILGHDAMRIEGTGTDAEVVTTQYARVPIEHVRRVAPLVLRLIQSGKTYQRNGHTIHLGHYALDSIDETGTVRVGCHIFLRDEIERIAGLIGETADVAEAELEGVTQ